jgi:hypothetical protein
MAGRVHGGAASGWAPALVALAALARAQDAEVALFKVVSARDEVLVGLTKGDLAAMGPGIPVEAFAAELHRKGQVPVWHYASTRRSQGDLVVAPSRRIVVLYPGTARIEPYRSALEVLPPKP